MSTIRRLSRVGLLTAALPLASCIDYDEEMWLESDLSGRVTMTAAVSDTLADVSEAGADQMTLEKLRQLITRTEGLSVESADSFRENGKQVTRITIRFEDVRRLAWLASSSKEPAWVIGVIEAEEKDGLMRFKRVLGPFTDAATSKSREQNAFARGLSGLLLGSNSLTYTLHLPEEPQGADSMQVDAKNKTVRWRFPLGQLMSTTGVMSVGWASSGFAWTWVFVILSLLTVVAYAWRWKLAR